MAKKRDCGSCDHLVQDEINGSIHYCNCKRNKRNVDKKTGQFHIDLEGDEMLKKYCKYWKPLY